MNKVDRFKILVRYAVQIGIATSQKDLGKKLGYSNESSFSQIINEKVAEPKDFIFKVKSLLPDLNSEWLETGEGEMLLSAGKSKQSEVPALNEKKVIRYWRDIEATGGGLVSFDDIKSDYTSYVLPDFRDCTDAVNIVGESMEPLYKSGSIILLKEWTESFIDFGNPYLIITKNGNRMVKILRSVEGRPDVVRCESKNPDYDPFEIYKADILRLYVVKGSISKNVM